MYQTVSVIELPVTGYKVLNSDNAAVTSKLQKLNSKYINDLLKTNFGKLSNVITDTIYVYTAYDNIITRSAEIKGSTIAPTPQEYSATISQSYKNNAYNEVTISGSTTATNKNVDRYVEMNFKSSLKVNYSTTALTQPSLANASAVNEITEPVIALIDLNDL